ncbi:hypothetical protein, partial [Nocardiopsis sp. TNDT3]|uniref:hypothetical protein n=1 Tax=Nocardiopsis sp. TNDT3 TaxID=2249354 RepID=UPI001E42FB3C
RDLYHQLEDDHCVAREWGNLGLALMNGGRRVEATDAIQRAVDLLEATGDEHRAALARDLLALIQQEPDTDTPG